jgi:hypothetical protein
MFLTTDAISPRTKPQQLRAEHVATSSSMFLETIIALLLPHITANASDIRAARQDILGLLRSYATRTRAECLLAAQIIALGMATLDALAEARSDEASASMRLRHRGNANSLNRAALQTAKALDQSLAQPLPPEPAIQPTPVDESPAAEAPIDPDHDTTSPHVLERNNRIWAASMIDSVRKLGLPIDLLTSQRPPPQP